MNRPKILKWSNYKKAWCGINKMTFITIKPMPRKKKFKVFVIPRCVDYFDRVGMHIRNPPVEFETMFDAACYAFTKQPK